MASNETFPTREEILAEMKTFRGLISDAKTVEAAEESNRVEALLVRAAELNATSNYEHERAEGLDALYQGELDGKRMVQAQLDETNAMVLRLAHQRDEAHRISAAYEALFAPIIEYAKQPNVDDGTSPDYDVINQALPPITLGDIRAVRKALRLDLPVNGETQT